LEKALLFTLQMEAGFEKSRNFILLIEPDVLVRNVLARLIAGGKCFLLTCSDALEAAAVLKAYAGKIRAVASSAPEQLDGFEEYPDLEAVAIRRVPVDEVLRLYATGEWSLTAEAPLPQWIEEELTGVRSTLDRLCSTEPTDSQAPRQFPATGRR
jgi:hypothetical protein